MFKRMVKKTIGFAVILAVLAMAEFAYLPAQKALAGGPVAITDCAELQAMNLNLAASYILMNNIDCIGIVNFIPVGDLAIPFTGTFDGNNKTISNLNITNNADYTGLFGFTSVATISNVVLESGSVSGQSYTGALVGQAVTTTITNSGSNIAVNTFDDGGDYSFVGGLVGFQSYGMIVDSYSTGDVTFNCAVAVPGEGSCFEVGGLAGGSTGSIAGSYSTADVSATEVGMWIGGLAGQTAGSGSISDSYATGNVISAGKEDLDGVFNFATGGFIGYATGSFSITNSYSTGQVSAFGQVPESDATIGGFIGYIDRDAVTITSSFWDTTTSGQVRSAGGTAGGTGKTTAQMKDSATYTSMQIFGAPIVPKWISVSAGERFVLAIKDDGTLWAWGNNFSGQLGQGDNIPLSFPTQVGADTDWQSVSAGSAHSLAIKTDHTLWAWGDNSSGQLGQGDTVNLSDPTQVGADTDWQSVSAGTGHSLAIKTVGTLWAWGDNENGQLGLADNDPRDIPIQVGIGTLWQSVSAGAAHSLAIKTDQTLWAWGDNSSGQLGLADNDPRNIPIQVGIGTLWQSVSAGPRSSHTIALKSDNTLWAWGFNETGQLGLGDAVARNTPIQVGIGADWQSISAGEANTIALKSDNTLWVWGHNDFGQIGLGDFRLRLSPVRVETAVIISGSPGLDTAWDFADIWSINPGLNNGYPYLTWQNLIAPPITPTTPGPTGPPLPIPPITVPVKPIPPVVPPIPPIPLPVIIPQNAGNLVSEPVLVIDQGTIYLIENGIKLGFRNMNEFLTYGFSLAEVLAATNLQKLLPLRGIILAKIGSLILDTSDNHTYT
ncbi:MAG: GLUG motif-containing protein [Candidatus Doudnabacteria bacterium]